MNVELIEKIAFWIVITATVIGSVLWVMYPPRSQPEKVLQTWQANHDAIIVVVEADTKDEALDVFRTAYPDYDVVTIVKGKKGWYIKGVKKNAGD